MPTLFLISNHQYIPYVNFCLWQTPLIGLHIAANALIAIACYSIPIILIYFVRQIEELPFKNIVILFGAFILFCGTTHLIEIWTFWHPNYWIYGIFKAITALISLYTAVSLIPIVPKALKFSSPQKLHKLNIQLTEQILEKETVKYKINRLNQELEQRVAQKTSALIRANQDLVKNTKFREKITDLNPNIIYIFDIKTNCNIYCNSFITELLGYAPSEIQELNNNLLDELVHPQDLELLKQHFNNCLNLQEDSYLEIEYRVKNTNGTWHWLHDKNTIFNRNSQGEVEQILGIAQDITFAKQAELETEALNQKLQEKITVLETRDEVRIKLARMNEFIQACLSLEEAQEIVGDLLQPLFPDSSGVVYLLNNSKKYC